MIEERKGENRKNWAALLLLRVIPRSLSVVKAKSSKIVCKEVNEAVDDDDVKVCRWVMEVALHDNMFLSLNFGFTAWAASREIRKEFLFIFSNRHVACGYVCEAST